VGVRARARDPPVRRHDLGGDQVVARQAAGPLEPAVAAAEGEPGDPGVGDLAAGDGEPVFLGRGVQLGPDDPGPGRRRPGVRVDGDALHRAKVHDEAVVADGQAGDAVAAAADRDRQAVAAGERDGRDDVGAVVQRAITAGRRSIAPFQTRRTSS
jgi:hypothetical protein